MKEATIRDVAKRAGVGVGTVSRVLNQHPSVSEASRRKVQAAIEELNYTPNPLARRFSLGKALAVAVVVPFFNRPVFVERLRGVEYAMAESQYDLILFNVETVAERDIYFRSIPRRELPVDGLLIMSLSPGDADVERFREAQLPTVLIDAYHPYLNRVVIDDVAGGHMATQHLIDLGHRKIAYVGDRRENNFRFVSSRDRYLGYRQALSDAGLPLREDYHREAPHGREQARLLAHALLDLADPPTAIFAGSDTQALGVLEATRQRGQRVPEYISVIGYDDIDIADYLSLSTVRQPSLVLGVEGVKLLLETIGSPHEEARDILLPVELVPRGTTGPPPQ